MPEQIQVAPSSPSTPASRMQLVCVATYLAVLAVVLFALQLGLWGAPADGGAFTLTLGFGLGLTIPSNDVRLLLMAATCGAFGSFIHAATSLVSYIGNQRIVRSWLYWYYIRPFIGGALAVILYFVTRAGLIGGASAADSVNVYGVAALAGLTGMFSKQATDKLDEVFKTMFKTGETGGDAQRSDKIDATSPLIVAVAPSSLVVGAPTPQLVITGARLVRESIVRIGGVAMANTMFDNGQITVTLQPEQVASAGELSVTVSNPGGATSPPVVVSVKT